MYYQELKQGLRVLNTTIHEELGYLIILTKYRENRVCF